MSSNLTKYPATPQNVSPAITQPGPGFSAGVKKVMGSIVLFFMVYIVLFVLAIGLVVASMYGGIAIMANVGHAIGILAGLGLIGLAVMVFIFLIKFLFTVSRHDQSGNIEITEQEQPALVAFIHQVARDTGAPVPKKIFLSPDVNACVFYNSSFWSMFFPVRKNLQIGLGLVNAVNVSEFKAIIAHEFGHFSQRSMKLGSFVYHVNKIIYNMLFENTGYSSALSRWASVSDIFAFFARVTAKIAQGIQWVLRHMYGFINKNYMGLSREMEFHADAVAASVSGSASLASALRRVELADAGYNLTLSKCDELFREKKVAANVYTKHHLMMRQLASDFKLQFEHGLPVVTAAFLAANNNSRINYKDQWASHPSTADRAAHLSELNVEADILTEPAWILFVGKAELETRLTKKIYEHLALDSDTQTVSSEEFNALIEKDSERFSLPDWYGGFYNGRQITIPASYANDGSMSNAIVPAQDQLLTPEVQALPKQIASCASDLETVRAIADKRLDVKTFDFDGVKYNRSQASDIAAKLEAELKEMEEKLKLADERVINYFIDLDNRQASPSLQKGYAAYFDSRQQADRYLESMNKMLESLAPVYSGQTISIEDINLMMDDLKGIHEPVFKKQLGEWIAAGIWQEKAKERENAERFLASSYVYFSGQSFFEEELKQLHELCNSSWVAVQQLLFQQFKALLVQQCSLLETAN